jgi:hypothetical protein
LLAGRRLKAFTAAGDPAGGCGNEVLVAGGRLIVLNGDGAAVGPVSVRELPLSRRR